VTSLKVLFQDSSEDTEENRKNERFEPDTSHIRGRIQKFPD
jgi:hypothetical protein